MFQSQLLIRGAATTKVYSPWFARGGDSVTITADLVAFGGSAPHLLVKVYTKESHTPGDGSFVTSTGTTIDLSAAGRASCEYNKAMNELVRYGFECTGSAGDWVLFRMLPAIWFDTVQGP